MSKFIEVIQNSSKDCGSSCLLSIIRYYGGNISHEELSLLLKTDNNGTTAYDILNGARSLGFDGYGIKYTYNDIIKNNITFPIIVHVLIKSMYHFIVIYKVDENRKKLTIMDPSIGITQISFEYFKKIYQNTSLVLFQIKKIDSIENLSSFSKYIFNYLKQEYKLVSLFFVLSLAIVVFSIIENYYMKIIIDTIIPNYFHKQLFIVSYLFINILFFNSLITFIKNKYLIELSNKISIKMNNETLNHIFNLPYLFFKNKSTGEVLSRISDIKRFKDIFTNIIINFSMNTFLILISMLVLLIIDRKLFIINLIFMILYFFIVVAYSKSIKNDINNYQISDGDYYKTLTESIEGYESNKNINMINYNVMKLETKFIIYSKKSILLSNTLNSQNYMKDIIINISYILTIFLGVLRIFNGNISLGDLIVFNNILVFFTGPLKNIIDLEPNLSYIKGVYNRINDLLIMKSKTTTECENMLSGDIKIKGLYYKYNEKTVLNNINIYVKENEKILLFGSSGSGKSTLIKILLKYIKDYKGEILINNTNIKDIDESLLSSSFTYVSQNEHLINDTLKNNIVYDRIINNDEYENIINICHVNKIRDSKPLRNNFIIEDNGFNISGGERQKIILARALLKKSNYIILDEALSEVGFNEEKDILNKIINFYKNKTIIYISHKKEIIKLFSKKYYLERNGRDK